MAKKRSYTPKADRDNTAKTPVVVELEHKVSSFIEAKARTVLLPLLLAVAAVLLIGVIAMTVSNRRQARIADGFAQLARAGDDVLKLQQVSQDYAGTGIGSEATLRLARQYMAEGDYAGALTQFEALIARYSDKHLLLPARFGRAYALEGKQDFAAAEREFLALVDQSRGNSERIAEAYMGAARASLARGNFAQAEAHARNALATTAAAVTSLYKQRAEQMLEYIQTKR